MSAKLELFSNEGEGMLFEPGQVIFSAGDEPDVMYVVVEGEVEVWIRGSIMEILGPGEPFGEMALIDKEPRVATTKARTACRVVQIPEKRFLYMVQQTPYFALQIMKVMAQRLRKMDARAVAAAEAAPEAAEA
jgi:CRP/FNR family transcriptional regulator, cyclic AMP receptor protein